jgi:hypothetical protein
LGLASFGFCVERFDEVMPKVDVVCAFDFGLAECDVFALECVRQSVVRALEGCLSVDVTTSDNQRIFEIAV